jgi:hypothetical protein
MANVISCLNNTNSAGIYILSGRPDGVALYVGVASATAGSDIPEAGQTFRAAFEGNFLGSQLTELKQDNTKITEMLATSKHLGLVTGVPTFNEDEANLENQDFQGIERLANSLIDETWQLIIVAEPGTDEEIRDTLDQIYNLSTQLSEHIKHSVQHSENQGWQNSETRGKSDSFTDGSSVTDTRGKNEGGSNDKSSSEGSSGNSWSKGNSQSQSKSFGSNESKATGTSNSTTKGTNSSDTTGKSGGSSTALTRERIDKRMEEMQKHVSQTLIDRFSQGRSKGMFRSAIYVTAETKATYDRLSRGVLSIFQGNQPNVTPLRVHKLQTDTKLKLVDLLQIRRLNRHPSMKTALVHSTPVDDQYIAGATWLNNRELALIMGLPSLELSGIKIRKSVDFALNTSDIKDEASSLKLGNIIQHGRVLPNKTVDLPLSELNKHIFITGVTGAGKTTTCMKLLLESDLPFLVIEPAKTEYRALYNQGVEIDYYTLGREDLTPFRLNPFELLKHQNLSSHIATLNATLAATFPMEAAMPSIVEEAIINAYKAKGWDIHTSENFISDDPWELGSYVWPTFADMIGQLDVVIKSKGMGKEFEEKYRGSLVARLTNLTLGTKGRMLNTRYSLDFSQLLDRRVVIELEEIKDEQDKALFMGLIIGRLAECMKQRHREKPDFKHLTLIEEAHRLLSRPEPSDGGSKKMGVEMFANLLAEVRKYGEGLIIADQIPNKLVSDVIKNTNIKIVHRLFSADDRNIIGDAMGLSDEQKEFLPLLQPGETVIYCGGWHAPVRVKIQQHAKTDNPDIPEAEFKQRGNQQLWAQRHKLLPKLAACQAMNSADTLADFLYQGGLMLNAILKINQNQGKQLNEKIRNRFLRLLEEQQQKLNATQPEVSALLKCLLLDCLNVSGWSAEDLQRLADLLPLVIAKLADSLDEFDQLIVQDRESKHVLQSLKLIDSI